MKTRVLDEFHICLEFSKTFTSVAITLWKLGKNVFYFFYKLVKRSENFFCFHRVMVNGSQPISTRVVSYLCYGKWLSTNQRARTILFMLW